MPRKTHIDRSQQRKRKIPKLRRFKIPRIKITRKTVTPEEWRQTLYAAAETYGSGK